MASGDPFWSILWKPFWSSFWPMMIHFGFGMLENWLPKACHQKWMYRIGSPARKNTVWHNFGRILAPLLEPFSLHFALNLGLGSCQKPCWDCSESALLGILGRVGVKHQWFLQSKTVTKTLHKRYIRKISENCLWGPILEDPWRSFWSRVLVIDGPFWFWDAGELVAKSMSPKMDV